MGSNVFGTPITEEMVKSMHSYYTKEKIGQKEKAIVALEMKNAEEKDKNAKKFVENLKNAFANVSVMCLIYNATGETMTFVTARDWKGRVCESPYPVIIANGQWGAFLHGQRYGNDKETKAGFVYSAFNNQGQEKHWFMGFYNSPDITNNRVYTEIQEPGYYKLENSTTWSTLESKLKDEKIVHKTNERGGLLFGSIGNISYTVFEAILTLPEAVGSLPSN